MLAVMVGWVFFRANDLSHAGEVLTAMVGLGASVSLEYHIGLYLDTGLALVLCAAAIGSTPWMPALQQWIHHRRQSWQQTGTFWPETVVALGRVAGLAGLLLASAIMMSASTYNPFIYFRF
jgi:hypothetical protein